MGVSIDDFPKPDRESYFMPSFVPTCHMRYAKETFRARRWRARLPMPHAGRPVRSGKQATAEKNSSDMAIGSFNVGAGSISEWALSAGGTKFERKTRQAQTREK